MARKRNRAVIVRFTDEEYALLEAITKPNQTINQWLFAVALRVAREGEEGELSGIESALRELTEEIRQVLSALRPSPPPSDPPFV